MTKCFARIPRSKRRGGVDLNSLKLIAAGALLFGLTACSAIPQGDLRDKYAETVRNIGLTPVYPPREDFQVGDVIHVSYDPKDRDNLDKYQRTWLGSLTSVMNVANGYLASRINFPDSDTIEDGAKTQIKADQDDLSSGRVTLDDGARRSLPIVSFPSVSGAASTAGSLGGYGFLRSFGLALGRNESVSLDFGDTRAFGLPDGGIAIDGQYEQEFRGKVCGSKLELFLQKDEFGQLARTTNGNTVSACPKGRTCLVMIVTRTFLTRTLTYNYTSAAIARAALNDLRGPAPGGNTTPLPLPGNLDVNVTLGPDADASQLDTLVGGLTTAVQEARTDGKPTNGLNFVGIQGNGMVFQRVFRKPVAIAYDALAGPPDFFQKEICEAYKR